MRVALLALLIVASAIGLAGCSLGGAQHRVQPTTATSATAPAGHVPAVHVPAVHVPAVHDNEVPTPVPAQTVAGGWRTPTEAIQVFATTYINWSARTVAARLSALARVSVGQARSAMWLAASQTGHDGELQRGGIGNAGVVEAIAPVLGHDREYAVITRERTTATRTGAYDGLAPAWHLALATVTRAPGGLWVLSGWQPEN